MDQYHIWCDVAPGKDMEFVSAVNGFLGALQGEGKIEGYRLTRRKLGLGIAGLGEFHVVIEVQGLAQLDEAFGLVATRAGEIESLHFGANSLTTNLSFQLERDFPDAVRQTGEEKF